MFTNSYKNHTWVAVWKKHWGYSSS